VTKFRQTRTRLQTSALALVAGALVAGLTLVAIGLAQTPASAVPASGFTITNTISSSPTSQSTALLYPGTQRYLWYNVSNVLTVPITVTSLSISAVTPPTGCALSNLNYASTTFTGNLVVPASGTNAVSVPISLNNLNTSQNNTSSSTENCASKSFNFTFTGTAQYTAVTTTVLTATPMSPAIAGQPVTLSATVSTSTAGATTPVGSVIFYSCTSAACTSKTALGSAVNLNSSGQASTTTTPATTGSYFYEAIYSPSDNTNFTSSTSNVVSRTVNFTNACGTSGKMNGGLTVSAGQFIFVNCTVSGAITVKSGGTLYLQGATANGGVTSTGASGLMICGSSVNGGVTATGTTGFVEIGDNGDDGSPACSANTIKGGVTLTNGTGGFEIAGSSISGGVSVTGNVGSGPAGENAVPEIENNTITGGLSCASSNTPSVTNGGMKNAVTGTKTGECSAAGF
jgi:hypothetical protein